MPLSLFATKPPLDEESVLWIFEVFDWGLKHLNRELFFAHTDLITPDNKHFPGRASSTHEMASLIFDRTVGYAGMQQWPLQLVPPGSPMPGEAPQIQLTGPLREHAAAGTALSADSPAIPLSYDPKMINNPEAMIAGFVQVLGHYLGAAVREEPPGGLQNWPQTTEVLGVFLGFGVLFANTAFNGQVRSCGSCGGPPSERRIYLSQYDVTYALALFCVLKDIPNRQVLSPLKPSLRGYFKRCRRDINKRGELLQGLQYA